VAESVIPNKYRQRGTLSIGSCFGISHRELFDIGSGHLIFKMRLKQTELKGYVKRI
jgi:hypothetical protein